MEIFVLASGSSGNSTLIRSNGTNILIDAGISRRQISWRLEAFGLSLESVDAILLTHEHGDHIRGLDVLCRHHEIPVWASAGTWKQLKVRSPGGGELVSGRAMEIGAFQILPVGTSHDAAEPLAFVLEDDRTRVGYCTDTGIFTSLLRERMRDLDFMLLEANHDQDMLRHGPYPWHLKQRIASRHGHLANHQAVDALQSILSPRLRALIALHLSEENNEPAMATRALGECLPASVALGLGGRFHMLRLDGCGISEHPAPQSRPAPL